MTVTVDRPPTVHRNRNRNQERQVVMPNAAQVEFAAQTVDDLDHNRPVTVTVVGEGGGWYVTAVDPYAFTYTVWRDGEEKAVAWAEVRVV